jgi:hypothetical protein
MLVYNVIGSNLIHCVQIGWLPYACTLGASKIVKGSLSFSQINPSSRGVLDALQQAPVLFNLNLETAVIGVRSPRLSEILKVNVENEVRYKNKPNNLVKSISPPF